MDEQTTPAQPASPFGAAAQPAPEGEQAKMCVHVYLMQDGTCMVSQEMGGAAPADAEKLPSIEDGLNKAEEMLMGQADEDSEESALTDAMAGYKKTSKPKMKAPGGGPFGGYDEE